MSKLRLVISFRAVWFLIGLGLLTGVLAVSAAPGDRDPTFGKNGLVMTDFGRGTETVRGVAIDHTGRILVAAETSKGGAFDSKWALSRYNPDGSLDKSFSEDGKLVLKSGKDDAPFAIMEDPHGRILVTGYSFPDSVIQTDYDMMLTRYTVDGDLDTNFSFDGKVVADFNSDTDTAFALAIDSDERIVIAGEAYKDNGTDYESDFALARYNSDGSPDLTFGQLGQLTTDYASEHDRIWAVSIDSEQRIVVAGFVTSTIQVDLLTIYHSDFALARYDASGLLDPSFDGDGFVVTDFGFVTDLGPVSELITDMVIDSDGRLVVAGHLHRGDVDFLIARYNSNGTLDTTFNGTGFAIHDFGPGRDDEAWGIRIDGAGRIVVGGATRPAPSGQYDAALLRLNADGTLDTSFGNNGKVRMDVKSKFNTGFDLAMDGGGRPVLAGYAYGTEKTAYDAAIMRYQTNPPIELIANGSFEALTPDPWTVKNAKKDGVVCQPDNVVVNDGSCAFRFTGSATENSTLQQDIDLTGKTFTAGDAVTAQVFVNSPAIPDAQLKLTVKYSDGKAPLTVTKDLKKTSGYSPLSVTAKLKSAAVSLIRVQIVNHSPAGKIHIDNASVSLSPVSAGSLIQLPLPPSEPASQPSELRSSKVKDKSGKVTVAAPLSPALGRR